MAGCGLGTRGLFASRRFYYFACYSAISSNIPTRDGQPRSSTEGTIPCTFCSKKNVSGNQTLRKIRTSYLQSELVNIGKI